MLRPADSSKHPDYLNNKMFTLALFPYVSDNKTPTVGFLCYLGRERIAWKKEVGMQKEERAHK